MADKYKKVLIVSYRFPPANSIGAVRVGKLAKYLVEFGWEPVVLTANVQKYIPQTLPVEIDSASIVRTPYFYLNPVLNYHRLRPKGGASISKLSKSTPQYRVYYNLVRPVIRFVARLMKQLPIVGNLYFEPVGWYFYAVKEGLKLLNQGDIQVIFSSSAPLISNFIAARLHHKTKIPWVAEYRDLWVESRFNNSRFHDICETQLEKKVMKECHTLVTVSEFTIEHLEAIHSSKIAVIHNGFDKQDYQEKVPVTSKFTITSTGNISPAGRRSPEVFFQAVAQLQAEGRISPDDFEVRLYGGGLLKSFLPVINKYHFGELVKIYDFVPFKECVRKQQESTVLLLLGLDSPLARHVYTGKVFEYLGANRPVLSVAYKTGAIDRLLEETGTGILVNEVKDVKGVIVQWLEEWQQQGKIISYWNPDGNVIKRYTRREGARKLAQLLNEASV